MDAAWEMAKPDSPAYFKFIWKYLENSEISRTFATKKNVFNMSYTKTTIIKNPSRKLEERVRWIGVQKYLWLEKLCSDETVPTKVIHVRWTKSTQTDYVIVAMTNH